MAAADRPVPEPILQPLGRPPSALVLFHGAGGDRDHRLFLRFEADLGIPVTRCRFPYREKGPGRRPPDRMPVLLDSLVAQVIEVADRLGVTTDRVVVGGRSMGGRVASMAAADGLDVAGLLLLSYPLHPPGKPENLRTEHFPALTVPTLFVQGTSDPFGRPHEIDDHVGAIPGPVSTCWLERTGHDPVERCDDTILDTVRRWCRLDSGSEPGA